MGVWHGSNEAGNRVSETFCDGWRTEHRSSYGIASFLGKDLMVEPREVPCSKELVVLCVEVNE